MSESSPCTEQFVPDGSLDRVAFDAVVDDMHQRRISEAEYITRCRPLLHSLAVQALKKWDNWHMTIDAEDVVQILAIEALARLGLIRGQEHKTWDPEHASGAPPGSYVFSCLLQLSRNIPRRHLRYKGPGTIPVIHHVGTDALCLEAGLQLWDDERSGSFNSDVPIREIISALGIRRNGDDESDAIASENAALERLALGIRAGHSLTAVAIDADRCPERYGGLNGERLSRLVGRICKVERRLQGLTQRNAEALRLLRVSDASDTEIKPTGYNTGMRHTEIEPFLTPEQQGLLELVPLTDREHQEIKDVIGAETIGALSHTVTRLYDSYLESTLPLARSLHYIATMKLWAIDSEYTTYDEFIAATMKNHVGSRSTIYALSHAYRVILDISNTTGRDTEDLWYKIGPYKIELLDNLDADDLDKMIELALDGATRKELRDAKRALLNTDDEIAELGTGSIDEFVDTDTTDVVDTDVTGLDDATTFNDGPAELVEFEDDAVDSETITLHGRVPCGVAIKLMPLDKEGEHDSLAGMDINAAAGRVYFEHRLDKSTRIGFTLSVSNGKLVGGFVQFDRT